MRKTRWPWLLLLLLLLGCQRTAPPPKPTPAQPKTGNGLIFTLSEGRPTNVAATAIPQADATPLSEEQTREVLDQMPAFKAAPEVADFSLRPKSLPRPRVAETVEAAFPPPASPDHPEAPAKALEVLRFAPQGEVPAAAQIAITFNQPMVALGSHEDQPEPPVSLTPRPEGRWRWVGAQTVVFDPAADRLPMATEFHLEIPAETASLTGQKLGQVIAWSFRTPAPNLVSSEPEGKSETLEPLLRARFDQKVEPESVLRSVRLKGGPGLRLASAEEISESGHPRDPEELVFKPTSKLKPETTYSVEVLAGTPSAEGPLTTSKIQSFSFATYSKLKVETHGGEGYDAKCEPRTPLFVSFTNPLATDKFQPSMVTVTPPVPNLRVEARGTRITLRGETRGRTTYTVALAPEIQDIFGQTLGETQALVFRIEPARPALLAPGGLVVNLDPKDPTHYPVQVVNIPRLKVVLRGVQPADFPAFMARQSNTTNPLPGRPLSETVLETKARPDELTEVAIDLNPALKNGKGLAFLELFVPSSETGAWEREAVHWLQATEIGLDVACDDAGMQVFASNSKGQPLSSVSLELRGDKSELGGRATTGADGLALLPLSDLSVQALVARLVLRPT